MDETRKLLEEIDAVLSSYESFCERHDVGGVGLVAPQTNIAGRTLMTRAEAAIERIAPKSSYATNAKRAWDFHGGVESQLVVMIGSLMALRDDLAANSLRAISELLNANTFSDFLEMASELLGSGYKDAAAVIAGTVQEQHLRALATKHGVSTRRGKKAVAADTVNANLVKALVYSKTTQKQVTANLGIRNDAAHGDYGNYTGNDVKSLIERVSSMIVDFPA